MTTMAAEQKSWPPRIGIDVKKPEGDPTGMGIGQRDRDVQRDRGRGIRTHIGMEVKILEGDPTMTNS